MRNDLNLPTVFEGLAWSEFAAETWNMKPRCIRVGSDDPSGMQAHMTVFLNRSGKLRMPRLTPYIPIAFRSTATTSLVRVSSQWLDASQQLAAEMERIGYGGPVSFSPSTIDVRPWQWLGHRAEVRYTYHIDFPYDRRSTSGSVRRNINKAQKIGYRCEATRDVELVHHCLTASEQRKGFKYGLTKGSLQRLQELLGHESCRLYVSRSPDNTVASARILLHQPNGRAIDWISGTVTSELHTGATQQLIDYCLEDLETIGARGFDYEGANIPSVARSKMEWGGVLTPFFTLRPRTMRTLALDTRQWLLSLGRSVRRDE